MILESNKHSSAREVTVIIGTISVAMVLSIVELPQSMVGFRPDFVALILIFWCYHRPKIVGLTTAFVVGLLTDVMFFGILGQHAFAKIMIAYFAVRMSKMEQRSPQDVYVVSVCVLGLLLLNTAVLRLVNVISLGHGGTDSLWIGAFVGTALWFSFAYFLNHRERTKYDFI